MRNKLIEVFSMILATSAIIIATDAHACNTEQVVRKVPNVISVSTVAKDVSEPNVIEITEEHIDEPVAIKCITDDVTEVNKIKKEPKEPYYVKIVDGYITKGSLKSICKYVGKMYDISPKILQAIVYTESRYNVNALGSSNDSGLCQIVPKWHEDRIAKLGVTDIFEPYNNVLICADILKELQSHFYGDDIGFVLMAYNMGPDTASEYYSCGVISTYANEVLNKAYELGY